jgi:predicted outer membrane repeat protein
MPPYHVDGKKGDDKNSGLDKGEAFRTLKKAVEKSQSKNCVTIIIHGTLCASTENNDNRFSVFTLRNTGCEINFDGADGGAALLGNKSRRVLYISGNDSKVNFKNIKITGGKAHCGGGVYIQGSRVTFGENVEISGNRAKWFGGGVFADNATVILDGCRIKENTAKRDGGAIYTRSMHIARGGIAGNGFFAGNIVIHRAIKTGIEDDAPVFFTGCGRDKCEKIDCGDNQSCGKSIVIMNAGEIQSCSKDNGSAVYIDNACFIRTVKCS